MNGKPGDGAPAGGWEERSHLHKTLPIREAHDATDEPILARDPHDEDGKLEVGLDESFPSSDPPASTQPRRGKARLSHDA